MHEIKVEILHAADFELAFEEGADIRLLLKKVVGKLVCEQIFRSVAAARQAFAERDLALSGKIAVRGIEIIEARVDEGIDHLRKFFVVHVAVFQKRQAHTAEAEVLFDLGKHFYFPFC